MADIMFRDGPITVTVDASYGAEETLDSWNRVQSLFFTYYNGQEKAEADLRARLMRLGTEGPQTEMAIGTYRENAEQIRERLRGNYPKPPGYPPKPPERPPYAGPERRRLPREHSGVPVPMPFPPLGPCPEPTDEHDT